MKKIYLRTISSLILGLVLFFSSCGAPEEGPGTEAGIKQPASSSPADSNVSVSGGSVFDPEFSRVFVFSSRGADEYSLDDFTSHSPSTDIVYKPWVNQIRCVAMVLVGDTVYFGVNGLGLGEISIENGSPSVEYPDSDRRFKDRVLGSISPFNGDLICQLYSDTVFSETSEKKGLPIIGYSIKKGEYYELERSPDHDPEEQLVEVYYKGEDWFLAWKKTGGRGVSFRYQVFNLSTGRNRDISSEEFRAESRPEPVSSSPSMVAEITDMLLENKAPGKTVIADWYSASGKSFHPGSPEIQRSSFQEKPISLLFPVFPDPEKPGSRIFRPEKYMKIRVIPGRIFRSCLKAVFIPGFLCWRSLCFFPGKNSVFPRWEGPDCWSLESGNFRFLMCPTIKSVVY